MNWETRILHLGLGRFHRGHQCTYYQKMSELGDYRWGVCSMSMRSKEARDQLKKVNLKYPVLELSAKTGQTVWVEAIRKALSAPDEKNEVFKAFTLPQIEIITLTITEKGYDLDSNGELDLNKSSIKHDLEHLAKPGSAIGILTLGLKERMSAGLKPVTVISCDNVRDNGSKLKKAVLKFASAAGWSDLDQWISEKIKFPNTMVDRIVPALLPEKIRTLENDFSLPQDSELIGTEEFCQWVIEDDFALERPEWEKVGVQFVSDVRAFEEMKLKLLNASHSYLAYGGMNRGFQFVHEAISDKELRSNVLKLYSEVSQILKIPAGFDVKAYQDSLIQRFENNKLPHQLKQIGMDGSQKLQQRIFPSLLAAIEIGSSHQAINQVVKEWIMFCKNLIQGGGVPDDPEAKLLCEIFSSTEWRVEVWEKYLSRYLKSRPELEREILG